MVRWPSYIKSGISVSYVSSTCVVAVVNEIDEVNFWLINEYIVVLGLVFYYKNWLVDGEA